MRKALLFFILLVLAAATAPLRAQQRVNIDIPGLAEKAAETTDITLDGSMLRLAAKFLDNDSDHAARDIITGLTGIYVRSYEFDRDGQYDRSVVDKVLAQLGPTWKRMVKVSGHREHTEIYLDMSNGDTPRGLLVVSAEAQELTLVHLVGNIDIDKLASIEGNFGIPRLNDDHKDDHKSDRKGKHHDE